MFSLFFFSSPLFLLHCCLIFPFSFYLVRVSFSWSSPVLVSPLPFSLCSTPSLNQLSLMFSFSSQHFLVYCFLLYFFTFFTFLFIVSRFSGYPPFLVHFPFSSHFTLLVFLLSSSTSSFLTSSIFLFFFSSFLLSSLFRYMQSFPFSLLFLPRSSLLSVT